MKEIITFMNEFIEKEYEAFIASYTEKDEEIFEVKQNQVDKMYAAGLRTIVQRGYDPDEEWFQEGKRQMLVLKKRILFQIKKYEHNEFETLYECSLSSPIGYFLKKDGIETAKWDDDISNIYYVTNIKSRVTGDFAMKIIADYHCGAERFAYGSKEIKPLGKLLETYQLEELKIETLLP
jgi:hypothetical protein